GYPAQARGDRRLRELRQGRCPPVPDRRLGRGAGRRRNLALAGGDPAGGAGPPWTLARAVRRGLAAGAADAGTAAGRPARAGLLLGGPLRYRVASRVQLRPAAATRRRPGTAVRARLRLPGGLRPRRVA